MHPVTLVFDLDGTLAETAPDIIAVLNMILADEDLPPVPLAAARELVGAGARALIARGFERQGRPLAPALLDDLFEKFLVIYAGHVAVDSHLFPGVETALEALAARGHRLAVCTNKPERHSRLLLDALGITERFAAICGRDTFTMCKPDPRHFTLTVDMAGGDPAQAIMIGDSKTDIDTARAAGVRVIAVPFGYTMVPVEELSPDRIIAHFDELPAAVADMLAG